MRLRDVVGKTVAVAAAALIAVTAGAVPAQAAITPAAGVQLKVVHSGKCLNVPNNKVDNSVEIIQYTCAAATALNDKWRVVAKPGGYQIQGIGSGKCLNVPNSNPDNSVKIIQYTCSDTAKNNLWTFAEVEGRTTYRIKSVSSGKCLNIPNNSPDNSAILIQYTCSTAATAQNDQFLLPPAATATITALATEPNTRVVVAQGGSDAVLAPLEVAYVNERGLLNRGYIGSPEVLSAVTWQAGNASDRYTGHPTVDKQADGRIVVGGRNAVDGDLNLAVQTAKGRDGFGAYADLGGSSASQPVTGTLPSGKLVTFALVGGSLWHLPQDGTYQPYGGWRQIGGSGLTGEPAVVTTQDGLRIFALTTAGTLQTATYANGLLSDFVSLGGTGLTGTPAAVSGVGYAATVAVRDADGHILVKGQQLNGAFAADWTQVGDFVAAGSPAIVMDPFTGVFSMVARGEDSRVHVVTEAASRPGVWGEWSTPLATEVVTDPTVVSYSISGGATWAYVVRDATSVYIAEKSNVTTATARAAAKAPQFISHASPLPAE
ncbi:RICIN domain-containing protein [Symbioplanes lichenis]|uniref:RICIN domain-containing protein n=1 Tax=Symbioplanes lichenis TaxID=1629072 RepID=UPI0027382929|nr:RICIN domain-containing protein [Actinoplanes lichenis]